MNSGIIYIKMKNRGILIGLVLLCTCLSVNMTSAQNSQETEALKRERLSRIDFWHVSVGASFAANRNFSVGPQLSIGVGSYRNLLNGDFGIRYLFDGPFLKRGEERVSVQQLPVFLSLNLNFARWRGGCVYLGGEMAFTAAVAAHHRFPDGQVESDIYIGKSHFTPAAKLGCRIQDCDISFFYEYDMKPSFNQKYIFETEGFDYDQLKYSIFERMRLGIRFLYHFNF